MDLVIPHHHEHAHDHARQKQPRIFFDTGKVGSSRRRTAAIRRLVGRMLLLLSIEQGMGTGTHETIQEHERQGRNFGQHKMMQLHGRGPTHVRYGTQR